MRKVTGFLLVILLFITMGGCSKAPTWQEQYDLGVRYLSEGNYEEAIIAFTVAIEIDPKQAEVYLQRGNAYLSMAQAGGDSAHYSTAEEDYLAALELDNLLAEAYEKLAEVYLAQDETDSAIDILRQGVEKTGDAALTERLESLLAQPHTWTKTLEDGSTQIIYGQENIAGEMQGFCIFNEFDASGTLVYACEADFTDGLANGELKDYWWAPQNNEHGLGVNTYQNGKRNGYSEVRCYHAMLIPAPDENGLIRVGGFNGADQYYEYRGVLVGDIREDDSGDAYIMSVNNGHVYEYNGQFKNNELDGYGQIYVDGTLEYEGQVYNWGPA